MRLRINKLSILQKKYFASSKIIRTFATAFRERRSVSSVGLERLLDRQEVTSSNLVQITRRRWSRASPFF